MQSDSIRTTVFVQCLHFNTCISLDTLISIEFFLRSFSAFFLVFNSIKKIYQTFSLFGFWKCGILTYMFITFQCLKTGYRDFTLTIPRNHVNKDIWLFDFNNISALICLSCIINNRYFVCTGVYNKTVNLNSVWHRIWPR